MMASVEERKRIGEFITVKWRVEHSIGSLGRGMRVSALGDFQGDLSGTGIQDGQERCQSSMCFFPSLREQQQCLFSWAPC
jgi:hypothetical protein